MSLVASLIDSIKEATKDIDKGERNGTFLAPGLETLLDLARDLRNMA